MIPKNGYSKSIVINTDNSDNYRISVYHFFVRKVCNLPPLRALLSSEMMKAFTEGGLIDGSIKSMDSSDPWHSFYLLHYE